MKPGCVIFRFGSVRLWHRNVLAHEVAPGGTTFWEQTNFGLEAGPQRDHFLGARKFRPRTRNFLAPKKRSRRRDPGDRSANQREPKGSCEEILFPGRTPSAITQRKMTENLPKNQKPKVKNPAIIIDLQRGKSKEGYESETFKSV